MVILITSEDIEDQYVMYCDEILDTMLFIVRHLGEFFSGVPDGASLAESACDYLDDYTDDMNVPSIYYEIADEVMGYLESDDYYT